MDGENAEIVLAVPLEIVVAHPDEQRRAGQILHVVVGGELQVVDERPLVIGRRRGRGHLQRRACGPQRLRGELLVALGGEVRLDGVGARRAGGGEREQESANLRRVEHRAPRGRFPGLLSNCKRRAAWMPKAALARASQLERFVHRASANVREHMRKASNTERTNVTLAFDIAPASPTLEMQTPRPQLGLVRQEHLMVTLRRTGVCSALVLTFALAGCGSDSTPPAGSGSGVGPTVSSTNPSKDGSGVALNVKVAATFSVAMDPATMTAATFTVHQGSATGLRRGLLRRFDRDIHSREQSRRRHHFHGDDLDRREGSLRKRSRRCVLLELRHRHHHLEGT